VTSRWDRWKVRGTAGRKEEEGEYTKIKKIMIFLYEVVNKCRGFSAPIMGFIKLNDF